MKRKRIDHGPRVVVAVRIHKATRERLEVSLRPGQKLSDRLREIIERAARRAA